MTPTLDDLADAIEATGALRSDAWRRVFRTVPRSAFARRVWHFATPSDESSRELLDGDVPEQRERWQRAVYGDTALATKFTAEGVAVSSTTEPSLMAQMLEALDVENGMRVLEIGTGTGYNAALLCERLGDDLVVSVEVDPQVAAEAWEALHNSGYHPQLVIGDGLVGSPTYAPYDRVIAACSTGRVPAAWIEQTRPGGIVLANIGHGAARLVVADDGRSATGQYLPGTSAFIEARPADAPAPLGREEMFDLCWGDGERSTGLVDDVLDDADFAAFLKLNIPSLNSVQAWKDDRPELRYYLYADTSSGSWARAVTNGEVVQGGPGRLFGRIADARLRWIELGRPEHHRVGLTVHVDGRHIVWVDEPGGTAYQLPDA